MNRLLDVAKALSDPNRVRVLMFLRQGELCLCQLIEMLHLAPSTVSKHMSVLRQAGLVCSRKEGRWQYYRRPGREADVAVRQAFRWLEAATADDPARRADENMLKDVLKHGKEQFCEHYRR